MHRGKRREGRGKRGGRKGCFAFGKVRGVVDGPLDQVGDGDVEAEGEGIKVDLVVVFVVFIVFIEEVVIEKVVGVGWVLGVEFGEGGEDGVESELGGHAQVLRDGWGDAKGYGFGLG